MQDSVQTHKQREAGASREMQVPSESCRSSRDIGAIREMQVPGERQTHQQRDAGASQ